MTSTLTDQICKALMAQHVAEAERRIKVDIEALMRDYAARKDPIHAAISVTLAQHRSDGRPPLFIPGLE